MYVTINLLPKYVHTKCLVNERVIISLTTAHHTKDHFLKGTATYYKATQFHKYNRKNNN